MRSHNPRVVALVCGWRRVDDARAFLAALSNALHAEMALNAPVDGAYFARRNLVENAERPGVGLNCYLSPRGEDRYAIVCELKAGDCSQISAWFQSEPKKGSRPQLSLFGEGSVTLGTLWAAYGRAVRTATVSPGVLAVMADRFPTEGGRHADE